MLFQLKVLILPKVVLFSVKSIETWRFVSDWFENFVWVAPPGSYSSALFCTESRSLVNVISHKDIRVMQFLFRIVLAILNVDNFLALWPIPFQICDDGISIIALWGPSKHTQICWPELLFFLFLDSGCLPLSMLWALPTARLQWE